MNVAASHGAGNCVPDAGLDAGRLVGDDQPILAVIALEVLSLIGREADGEIVVVPKFEFGRLKLRIGHFGPLGGTMDLEPQLSFYLPLSGRGRKNDAFRIAGQPPQSRISECEGFANSVAGLDRSAASMLNGAQDLDFALP